MGHLRGSGVGAHSCLYPLRVPPPPHHAMSTLAAQPSSTALDDKSQLETLETLDSSQSDATCAPVDRGFAAWSNVRARVCRARRVADYEQLLASCVIGLFVWGFPNSSGALLAAYFEDARYMSQPHATSRLPLIGTLSTGILYCSGTASSLYMTAPH